MNRSVSAAADLDFYYNNRRSSPLLFSTSSFKMGNSTVRIQRPIAIATFIILSAFLFFLYVAFFGQTSSRSYQTRQHDDGHRHSALSINTSSYNFTYPLTKPIINRAKGTTRYRIALISDLDQSSKDPKKENSWLSYLKYGYLIVNAKENKYDLEWDSNNEDVTLKSNINAGGRGMELSELIVFNGKLYTADDRTGIIYQVDGGKVYPWAILADGNGRESKGFKCEWMAVKDKYLYVGGLGKEWTTSDGNVINFNPMYVKKIDVNGRVEHINWHDNYVHLRSKAGIEFPGYMIHESAAWSDIHNKWFFLPRRASKSKYNDVEDERHGTNLLLSMNEDGSGINVSKVGDLNNPSHGFSSFKFVPGTDDEVIIALKSEELEGKISSYIMVFKTDGTFLYPESKIGDHKYEGVEFI